MLFYNKIDKQIIIEEYLNGMSILKLSKKYEIPYKQIQKILNENQITIRGGRKKIQLSEEQLEQLRIDVEENNLYDKDLELKYQIDITTIQRIMRENNIKRPNKNKINRKIKSNYFSILDSPEKAYWIGFLFTDGSVDAPSGNKSARIRISLQVNDKEILDKLKETLCIESKLIYDKRDNKHTYSLEFMDNQIYYDLNQYGIIPNKTYKTQSLPFDKIPEEYISAFLLGLFDGDGCLTYSKNYSTDVTFGFTSYYENICKDFQKEINKLINKPTAGSRIFTSAWHVNWRGRLQVLKILDILYKNCPIHLERKYQKYLALKNSLN